MVVSPIKTDSLHTSATYALSQRCGAFLTGVRFLASGAVWKGPFISQLLAADEEKHKGELADYEPASLLTVLVLIIYPLILLSFLYR